MDVKLAVLFTSLLLPALSLTKTALSFLGYEGQSPMNMNRYKKIS